MKNAVKTQLNAPSGQNVVAEDTVHFNALEDSGLKADDVIKKVAFFTVGGFEYQNGLYVGLPFSVNDLPVYGCIVGTYLKDETAYVVTEDCNTVCYDSAFGAYEIENSTNSTIRAFKTGSLAVHRPMTAWTPYNGNSSYHPC